MKKAITVSAPGKLMLLGEHAVVYNHPCLVTSVSQRMKTKIESLDYPIFQLEAPDVGITKYKKAFTDLGQGDIPQGAKFAEIAVLNFISKYPLKDGIKVETNSEFSSKFGFGSSSASSVCVIKALSELVDARLSQKEIFDIAYKTILQIQGRGSGFDVAAATYGGLLYFFTGGKIIEPLNIKSLPLVVGYSGVKADSVTLMNQVAELAKQKPELIQGLYNQIGTLVEQAKQALLKNDWAQAGQLMNQNQEYLNKLGVSTGKLNKMIYAARGAGAYGAKLSGAGGGDCMIALVPEDKRENVQKAIASVGEEVLDVSTNVEGVLVEN